jgi:hypothetical protein
MQLHKIQNLERRVRAYWYEDGIAEMATGGVFVLLGLYFGLQGYLGEGSTLGGILQASLILLFIAGAYVTRRVINSLKARLTYPRTGYVAYHVDARATRLRGIAAGVLGMIAAALLIGLYGSVHSLDAVVLATGVLIALIWAILCARAARVNRFYALAALSLALGAVLSLSGWPQGYALGCFYGSLGIATMVSGGLALRQYLDRNPIPAEAGNGR